MDNYLAFVLSAFINSGLLEVICQLRILTLLLTLMNVLSFKFISRLRISCSSIKGLVEVITSNEDPLAIRATILLGELLHMVICKSVAVKSDQVQLFIEKFSTQKYISVIFFHMCINSIND